MNTAGLTYEQIVAYVEGLTEAERLALSAELDAEDAHRKAHPLAYAKMWDGGPGRTSQRRNAATLMTSLALHRFELGGNRSGKSEGGAQRDVAYALGSDHPDTIAWARLNEIDLAATDIRPGGCDVWVVTPDSGDSRRFARPKVARYLPAGCVWRNRDGGGEAEVILPGGRKITFKSVDQGRDGFQGDAVGRIRFDEEPRDPGVVAEARMRIVDHSGHLEFTMTPLYGWTQLLDDHVKDPEASDTVVGWLHGTDNPHVPRHMLERILRAYGSHERAARERGEIVALEGRVYMDWRRDLHVIRSFEPPPEWLRFRAVDFGVRNPCAILWVAWDQRDDVLHVYRESYEADKTTEWNARRCIEYSGGEEYEWTVADSAALAERRTWLGMGIVTVPSLKRATIREGISMVAERLAPDDDGKPHILVHDNCPRFIREIEGYVWASRNGLADQPEAPLKKADHLMDDIRYLVERLNAVYGRERVEAAA